MARLETHDATLSKLYEAKATIVRLLFSTSARMREPSIENPLLCARWQDRALSAMTRKHGRFDTTCKRMSHPLQQTLPWFLAKTRHAFAIHPALAQFGRNDRAASPFHDSLFFDFRIAATATAMQRRVDALAAYQAKLRSAQVTKPKESSHRLDGTL